MQLSHHALNGSKGPYSAVQANTQQLCLLLADVVGSTVHSQKNGDVSERQVLQRHYDALAPLILDYDGNIIKTIDQSMMASFSSAKDALNCSVAIQQELWNENQIDPDNPLRQTKISLHYGSLMLENDEAYGELVDMSACLLDTAEAEQILISQAVFDQLNPKDTPPLLPHGLLYCKAHDESIDTHEVLWQQSPGFVTKSAVFRNFSGSYQACFYCGLQEHLATNCPSKQLSRHTGKLNQLGYQPLHKVLGRFQQAELDAEAIGEKQSEDIFEAYYEIYLPYQLRFLCRIWIATNENWRTLCQPAAVHNASLHGTRLWLGIDALRAGRIDEAEKYLLAARDSNRGDYKPYSALGFLAMEKGEPFTARQYWQNAIPLVKTNLQGAYLHLLLHRLYMISDQSEQAQQELNKALNRYPYLDEANYRRRAIQFQVNSELNLASYIKRLTAEDRTAFLKVVLDPAFEQVRGRLAPILTNILQETRNLALVQMNQAMKELNSLREWYQQPEAELQSIESTVKILIERIKSDSYLGFYDAVEEGDRIQKRCQIILSQRIAYLHKGFKTSLLSVEQELKSLLFSIRVSGQAIAQHHISALREKLARLQEVDHFSNADQFWCAWNELQALKGTIKELDPTRQHQNTVGQKSPTNLKFILLSAISGSVMVNLALLAFLAMMMYVSQHKLTGFQLFIFFGIGNLGGLLAGAAVGGLWRWYRPRR